MFKASDIDEDGLLNRQEFEEYFKFANRQQKKWGQAARQCSPEWYDMYYDAINARCSDYEGCSETDLTTILKAFLPFFTAIEGSEEKKMEEIDESAYFFAEEAGTREFSIQSQYVLGNKGKRKKGRKGTIEQQKNMQAT